MSKDAFSEYLDETYQGEILGEAFFAAMAGARSEPEEARKLRALERLERETKQRLAAELREAGRSADAHEDKAEQGRALGAQLGQAPWRDLLASMRPELVRFVDEFRKAEALAPAGKESLARHVTSHEQALLDFVDAELAEDASVDSLESVSRLLTS